MVTTPVDVSSGESRKEEEEEEEEEEERDSEATRKEAGETSPLRKADIHRTLPDDDDEADVPLEREELPVAGGSRGPRSVPGGGHRSRSRQEEGRRWSPETTPCSDAA